MECSHSNAKWLALFGAASTQKLEVCFLHWSAKQDPAKWDVDKFFDRIYNQKAFESEYTEYHLHEWYTQHKDTIEMPETKQSLLRLAFTRKDTWTFWSFCRGPRETVEIGRRGVIRNIVMCVGSASIGASGIARIVVSVRMVLVFLVRDVVG